MGTHINTTKLVEAWFNGKSRKCGKNHRCDENALYSFGQVLAFRSSNGKLFENGNTEGLWGQRSSLRDAFRHYTELKGIEVAIVGFRSMNEAGLIKGKQERIDWVENGGWGRTRDIVANVFTELQTTWDRFSGRETDENGVTRWTQRDGQSALNVVHTTKAKTFDVFHKYGDKKPYMYYKQEYNDEGRLVFVPMDPDEQGALIPLPGSEVQENRKEAKDGEGDGAYYRVGQWHLLGAALIESVRTREGEWCSSKRDYTTVVEPRYYLSAMDERQYFVSHLRADKTPSTVTEALEQLKPDEVRAAEKKRKQILRQGEWFFVHVGDDKTLSKQLRVPLKYLTTFVISEHALPVRHAESNKHVVEKMVITKDDRIFCHGVVAHYNPDATQRSNQHADLKLSAKKGKSALVSAWFEAFRNTEQEAYSEQAGVRFD